MRIVIYRGQTALQTTEVAPAKAFHGKKTDVKQEDKQEENKELEVKAEEAEEGIEEIYLGHIAEAHYVSLRKKDWKETLIEGICAQ